MAPTFQNAHLDYHIEVQHLREEVAAAFFTNRNLLQQELVMTRLDRHYNTTELLQDQASFPILIF